MDWVFENDAESSETSLVKSNRLTFLSMEFFLAIYPNPHLTLFICYKSVQFNFSLKFELVHLTIMSFRHFIKLFSVFCLKFFTLQFDCLLVVLVKGRQVFAILRFNLSDLLLVVVDCLFQCLLQLIVTTIHDQSHIFNSLNQSFIYLLEHCLT